MEVPYGVSDRYVAVVVEARRWWWNKSWLERNSLFGEFFRFWTFFNFGIFFFLNLFLFYFQRIKFFKSFSFRIATF